MLAEQQSAIQMAKRLFHRRFGIMLEALHTLGVFPWLDMDKTWRRRQILLAEIGYWQPPSRSYGAQEDSWFEHRAGR